MTDDLRPVCEDYDPRVWYPHRADEEANRFAVSLCLTCPLRVPCLEGALERDEKFGIWGATTERDRAAMVRGAA